MRLTVFFTVSLLALSHVPSVVMAEREPADMTAAKSVDVKNFIASIGAETLKTLTNKNNTLQERQDAFQKILSHSFDTKAIGKFALGRYWKRATDSEKNDYLKYFVSMIAHSYAIRFQSYAGETFQTHEVRTQEDGGFTVTSDVVHPEGGNPIKVLWRVYPTKDGPRVFDVLVDGISMSVTQRSEFAAIIEQRGGAISALIENLRAKTMVESGLSKE